MTDLDNEAVLSEARRLAAEGNPVAAGKILIEALRLCRCGGEGCGGFEPTPVSSRPPAYAEWRSAGCELLRQLGYYIVGNHVEGGVMEERLRRFTEAYIDCALWADAPEEAGQNLGPKDLSPEALEHMTAQAKEFFDAHNHLFGGRDDYAGHDFWLTHQGHGTGFWDRGMDGVYPEGADVLLTLASRPYGLFPLLCTVGFTVYVFAKSFIARWR